MEAILNKAKEYLPDSIDLDVLLKFIKDHKVAVATTSIVVLYGAWFFKRPKNLPPGPYGYPVIGSLGSMMGDVVDNLQDMGDKYGEIFTLWFGNDNYTVVLNSHELISEVALKRGTEFLDKKDSEAIKVLCLDETLSTASYHDNLYQMSRKIAVQGVRTVLTTKLDGFVKEEMEKLMKSVSDNGRGIPIEMNTLVKKFGANIALGVLFNKTYDNNDPEFIKYLEDVNKWYDHFMEMFALDLYGGILKLLMHNRIKAAKEATRNLEDFVIKHTTELRSTISQGKEIRSLVDAYLRSEEQNKFPAKKLAGTVLLLMPDSVRTIASMCIWQIIYLLHNPKYQDLIFKEVQSVIGTNPISINNRPEMPLTEAFTMEVFRHVMPAAFGGLNLPTKETTLRGYRIPKNVSIMTFYGGVMRNPKYFPEPKKFIPERFITDGKVGKVDGFWPFGLGRRSCIGEQLSRSVIFMFLGSLVQKYKITQGPEGLPSLKKDPKAVEMVPQKFKVFLEERT